MILPPAYMRGRGISRRWVLIFWMPWVVAGFAQTPPPQKKAAAAAPAPARWPIQSILVEGNHTFTREQVLGIAGLKIGQTAGRPEFDAARDRLSACGAFDTVSYKFVPAAGGGGYVLTLTFTEVDQVYPVRFEDLHVSERDLVASLQAKDPLFAKRVLPATQPVFERYARWVEQYLKEKGIEEKITAGVEYDRPGEYSIVFHPARPLPVVAHVTFRGNQVVPLTALQDAILMPAVGMPYTEDRFRAALNTSVRPVYEARGRLRVAFPEIKTDPDKDVQGVDVTVTVDEGESYNLGKVALEPPTPLKPEELLKAGDFKSGDVANFDHVKEGLDRIGKALKRSGYLKAEVTSRRQIDDDKRTVDVTVFVDAGPQFLMRKLTVVGLDLDSEAEINRIWTMKAGKPFNPEYPDSFLARVRDEGLFDNLGNTKAEYKLNEQEHTADVTLTFSGKGGDSKPGRGGRRGGA